MFLGQEVEAPLEALARMTWAAMQHHDGRMADICTQLSVVEVEPVDVDYRASSKQFRQGKLAGEDE